MRIELQVVSAAPVRGEVRLHDACYLRAYLWDV